MLVTPLSCVGHLVSPGVAGGVSLPDLFRVRLLFYVELPMVMCPWRCALLADTGNAVVFIIIVLPITP
jgi:hypothetical protein